MTVYVDPAVWPFGRMVMCHMWADSRVELYAMVDTIGVDRKWLQRPDAPDAPPGMNASWEHFDIAKSKRALAIQAGAVPMDEFAALEASSARDILTFEPDAIIYGLGRLKMIRRARSNKIRIGR